MAAIIDQYELPDKFPSAVRQQARRVGSEVNERELESREDLSGEVIVTIDGADAQDLDDAISLTRAGENYLLGVHIADVAHYVKAGGPLDREALRRGNSVYFPGRVLPMLPKELSNGICSLNPREKRLCLSCFMEITPQGEIAAHRISETVICSHMRLNYNDVSKFIAGKLSPGWPNEIKELLLGMHELAKILGARRHERGSIDFDVSEAYIKLDGAGRVTDVRRRAQGVADKIIEEFMIVCNEVIAEHFNSAKLPFIYRVHEPPSHERLGDLKVFLDGIGYTLHTRGGVAQPKDVQTVLGKAKGRPEESIINRVALRAMQKAVYGTQNLGHFGLAARDYTHFTAPIRRYSDLTIHRIIKWSMNGELTQKRRQTLMESLPDVAERCSERERAAMEAERAADDLYKCEYMHSRIGESFTGVISGVTNAGLFVELDNTVEGLVRMGSLQDDYYVLDEKSFSLRGRRTKNTYRLGEPIDIIIAGVNYEIRKIEFALASAKLTEQSEKGKRHKAKVKVEAAPPKKAQSGKKSATVKRKRQNIKKAGRPQKARKRRV